MPDDFPPSPDESLATPRLSPSLESGGGPPAYEIKFLLTEDAAAAIERRVRDRLAPDPFGAGGSGTYKTATLYFDTPALDVVRRTPGYRRRKYRVRRYGADATLHFERKVRRGDKVRKLRETVVGADLAALLAAGLSSPLPGAWFREETAARDLIPVCRMTYVRTAFGGVAENGGVRLTFDRAIRGVRESGPVLDAVESGPELLPDRVICEMKFRAALPGEFKRLVAEFGLEPTSVSKYRRAMGGAAGADRGAP